MHIITALFVLCVPAMLSLPAHAQVGAVIHRSNAQLHIGNSSLHYAGSPEIQRLSSLRQRP